MLVSHEPPASSFPSARIYIFLSFDIGIRQKICSQMLRNVHGVDVWPSKQCCNDFVWRAHNKRHYHITVIALWCVVVSKVHARCMFWELIIISYCACSRVSSCSYTAFVPSSLSAISSPVQSKRCSTITYFVCPGTKHLFPGPLKREIKYYLISFLSVYCSLSLVMNDNERPPALM